MKNETQLVRMLFGSVVYGCSLPTSDRDEKGVFVPDARDLLLGHAPTSRSFHSNTKDNVRNTADDVDREDFSLSRYLDLLSQGQVIAWDMLFTPDYCYISKPDPLWLAIKEQKDKLLHKKMGAFVGYAKAQAHKYSLRGDRMLALQWVIRLLDNHHGHAKLHEVPVGTWAAGDEKFWEFIKVVSTDAGTFLEVCGKQVGMTASVKYALTIYKEAYADYGARARAAAEQGADYKALYHAVRIQNEAVELLTTGNISFPRPEAEYLLKIRRQEVPYEEIAAYLEEGIESIYDAQQRSTLPDEPDRKFMESLVVEAHWNQIKGFK